MQLHRHPPISVVLKETSPEFIEKHGFGKESLRFLADQATPPSFSLRDRMTPARYQGSAGTCASFGCLAPLEYFHRPSGADLDLSEGETTHVAEKAYGDCAGGIDLGSVMKTLRDNGAVLESDWRYDQFQICWTAPPNVGALRHYKYAGVDVAFYRPRSSIVDYMRQQLQTSLSMAKAGPIPGNFVPIIKNLVANAKYPVSIGVPVWWKSGGHFEAGWEDGPDIQMPTPAHLRNFIEAQDAPGTPPNVSGWHCIAICGYDDSRGRFIFKNSWASWWGDAGFGTIPYDYVTQYASDGWFGWI